MNSFSAASVRLIRALIIVVVTTLALLLGGCVNSTYNNPPYNNPTANNQFIPQHAEQMHYWELEGKIAIKYQGKSRSGYFTWQQQLDDYNIHIYGPLGQGSVRLINNPNGIRLIADGREQLASSAEELLAMNLGWSFPVSDMIWWIRGLASPTAAIDDEQYRANGELKTLRQQGWTIEYPRHQKLQQLNLPYKLIASRDNIRITLLLKKWEI